MIRNIGGFFVACPWFLLRLAARFQRACRLRRLLFFSPTPPPQRMFFTHALADSFFRSPLVFSRKVALLGGNSLRWGNLFNGDGFGEVAGLVDVGAAVAGRVVGQKLNR